jgi:hypothetical protein
MGKDGLCIRIFKEMILNRAIDAVLRPYSLKLAEVLQGLLQYDRIV